MPLELPPWDVRVDEEPPRLSVYLHIRGGPFDPEEVTRRLGVEPTESFRAGDPRPHQSPHSPKIARRDSDGWNVRVGPEDAVEIAPLCVALLEEMSPAPTDATKEMLVEMGLEAVVRLCVLQPIESTTPVIETPGEFVEWMGAIGASLEVDIILTRSD